MQIISAFLADHVAVYDGKLNVLGGVWASYVTDALPHAAEAPLALVVQVTTEDTGRRSSLSVALRAPDGREQQVWSGELVVAPQQETEYVCTALRLRLPFDTAGRHVIGVAVGGVEQVAFPLQVEQVRPQG